MSENKLRLMEGDWVQIDFPGTPMHAKHVMVVIDDSGRLAHTYPDGPDTNPHNAWHLAPIPITAEILRDWFGFRDNVAGLSIGMPWARILHFEGNQFSIIEPSDSVYIPRKVEFVHELQHLYEALTEKPLRRIGL